MARLFFRLSMHRLFVAVASVLFALFALVSLVAGQETPMPNMTLTPPTSNIEATPTIDRLAPPPTVVSPTQADEGDYLFWLHCQPCHGDQGQGLTDEWRMQYPETEQYCWNSGCHGNNPYEGGFTIPTVVPAVVGDGSLARFQTLGQLYDYIRVAMPLSFPGTLTEEEYLAITAFLAQRHGMWDGRTLDAVRIHDLRLQPETTAESGTLEGSNIGATPTAALAATPVAPTAGSVHGAESSPSPVVWGIVALIALLMVGGVGVWWRNR